MAVDVESCASLAWETYVCILHVLGGKHASSHAQRARPPRAVHIDVSLAASSPGACLSSYSLLGQEELIMTNNSVNFRSDLLHTYP
jgi:hypothetical protein